MNVVYAMSHDAIRDEDEMKRFKRLMDWPIEVDPETWGTGAAAQAAQDAADRMFGGA